MIDRRRFLKTGVAGSFAASTLVACGGGSDVNTTSPANASNTNSSESTAIATPPTVIDAQAIDLLLSPAAFVHSVASGDPQTDRVILWTAITPANSGIANIPVYLQYIQSNRRLQDAAAINQLFAAGQPVQQCGPFMAQKALDWCLKVDLGAVEAYPGLQVPMRPLDDARFVYYRFTAGSQVSPIGRARLLPKNAATRSRFAVTSCASYPHGWFSVYEMIAQQDDLDFVLHLGDYIYEYADNGNGIPNERYSSSSGLIPNAVADALPVSPPGTPEADEYGGAFKDRGPAEPIQEITDAPTHAVSPSSPARFYNSDYTVRHSQYKRDPQLQRLHLNHPLIAIWDDHEFADNAYREGANNHTEGKEGTWVHRRRMATRAYLNWMPIRETQPRQSDGFAQDETIIYRRFQVGQLLDLWMLDTRIIGRDKQVALMVDPARNDPARSLLGGPQRQWLYKQMVSSTAQWKFLGQQVMFGQLDLLALQKAKIASTEVFGQLVPFNMDQWDGYTAERGRIYDVLSATQMKNFVVLTGDIHTSWAIELHRDSGAVTSGAFDAPSGVELVTPSVTSPGFPDQVAQVVSAGLPVLNPHVKYTELKSHGYILVDVNTERMISEWHYAKSISDKKLVGVEDMSLVRGYRVNNGQSRLLAIGPDQLTQSRSADGSSTQHISTGVSA